MFFTGKVTRSIDSEYDKGSQGCTLQIQLKLIKCNNI